VLVDKRDRMYMTSPVKNYGSSGNIVEGQ